MKKLFFFLILFSSIQVFAQDDINVAMKTGNADGIAKYFDKQVDINLPNHSGIFSVSQAKSILENFFNSNTPKDFQVKHKGSSKSGSIYQIGTLNTENGKAYRSYILYKKENEKLKILEFRLEPDDEE